MDLQTLNFDRNLAVDSYHASMVIVIILTIAIIIAGANQCHLIWHKGIVPLSINLAFYLIISPMMARPGEMKETQREIKIVIIIYIAYMEEA